MSKLIIPAKAMKKNDETMFFEYRQNNSGGHFISNHNVSMYVVIEAKDAKQADSIAEDVGLYFNGCDDGRDCSCCGDRWYAKLGFWNKNTPGDYDTLQDVEKAFEVQGGKSWQRKDSWASPGEPYAVVYKLNGDKIVYIKDR